MRNTWYYNHAVERQQQDRNKTGGTQKMKECEVIDIIKAHNESVDKYINGELAKKLHAKNGKIKMDQWFEAQRLIREQDFYGKGNEILKRLRAEGFDVKMDMQANKLVYKWYR
jgi:hypothetical protein